MPGQGDDGKLACLAVGDWLLPVLIYQGEETTQIYNEIIQSAQNNRVLELFQIFLSRHGEVAATIRSAKATGSVKLPHNVQASDKTGDDCDGQAREVKKSYLDILRESEDFFTVLMTMIQEMNEEDKDIAIKETLDALTVVNQSDVEFAELKLRILMCLYNMLAPEDTHRYLVFIKLVEYASAIKQFELIAPYIHYIPYWMEDWNLSGPSKRHLYLFLAKELKQLHRDAEAFEYLRKHVAEFQQESPQILQSVEVLSAAVALAEEAIQRPSVMYFDEILTYDAIKQLANTPDKPLYDLLKIFLNKGANDLERFYNENKELFQKHKFDYAGCECKIRLLAVASCAATLGTSELPIDTIAKQMSISEDAVEELVVRAIGAGLLDAKIDQINRVILVKSAMQRNFTEADWQRLDAQLTNWTAATRQLMEIMKE